MEAKPVKKLENTATLLLFAGTVLALIEQGAQSHQWEYSVLAGLFFTVGAFDYLLVLFANNRDPSKASPAVFPLVLLLLVMLILSPLLTVRNAIQYFKADHNVSYAVKKDTGIVRRVYGGDTEVVLADEYKDTPVTVIEKRALYGRSSMESVKLPAELKEICANAFQGCKRFTEVELPDGLEVIGKNAFAQCKSLRRVTIPASVTEIPKSAFNGCPKDMVIVGEPGSAAQIYAEKYFTFEALSP